MISNNKKILAGGQVLIYSTTQIHLKFQKFLPNFKGHVQHMYQCRL